MLQEREKQKEEQVEALKLSMQSGMVCSFDENQEYRPAIIFQLCAVC